MKRIESIDIIRGISILGILFMNIVGYHANYNYVDPLVQYNGLAEVWLQKLSILLVHNSFYPIFSFLFGFSMAIMADNISKKGKNIIPPLLRRMVVLLVFGLIHGSILFYGDILNTYACFGLILLVFLMLSPNIALFTALSLIIIHFGMNFHSFISVIQHPEHYQLVVSHQTVFGQEVWQEAVKEHDILLILGLNMGMFLGAYTPLIGGSTFIFYLMTVFPFMLLGSYTYRTHLLNKVINHKQRAIAIASILFMLGIGIKGFGLYHHLNHQVLGEFLYDGGILIAAAYLLFVIVLCDNERVLPYLRPFGDVGKLSLTCYISQSIFMFLLFYIFGLYSSLSLWEVFSIALAIALFQMVSAHFYLKKFKRGPIESIWRKVTYLSKKESSQK